MPKIYILILNWNNWKDTIECLESVLRNDYTNYQVIVVDNGSQNKSMEYIKAWAKGELNVWINPDNPLRNLSYPPVCKPIPYVYYTKDEAEKGGNPEKEEGLKEMVRNNNTITTQYPLVFIQTGNNLGFAGGNNVGIRYTLSKNSDYIFILNNDTVMAKTAVTEMVNTASTNPKSGMITPCVFNYYEPNVIDRLGIVLTKSGLGYNRKSNRDGPLLCPSGCAALYSRTMLFAIASDGEYFDEDFFMYCEDMDLGIRAQHRGFKAALAEKSQIFHKLGNAIGGSDSLKGTYFLHRNTIWTIVKNFPFKILVKNFLWILIGQIGALIKNLGTSRLCSVIKGKAAGIKGIRKMWQKRFRCNKCNLPIDGRPFILRQRQV